MLAFLLSCLFLSPAVAGPPLLLNWCNSTSVHQNFIVEAGKVTDKSGQLCVTKSSPYPAGLTMEPCTGSPSQSWDFNSSWGNSFSQGSVCWNTQGGDGFEGPGSYVGLWDCSNPTAWNSIFDTNFPFSGAIAAMESELDNKTWTNLCVDATPPPPPPPPPFPSPQQLAWHKSEMACFIHYNMASAVGSQGCGGCGGPPPDLSKWNPANFNPDSWISAGIAMGCKRFVYVAKHGCGFTTWPSNSTIAGQIYPYSVRFTSNTTDLVTEFVASAKRAGVGFGFYYSLGDNAFLNACSGSVHPGAGKGQMAVTQDQFNALVISQLTELWSAYGPLAEVWFDGGYPASQAPALKKLFASLQPDVVAFQAAGLMPGPVRWVGTESGFAPYPFWSTIQNVDDFGPGDPDGGIWAPGETDFTLQAGDNWFYNPGAGIRSFQELQKMYETSTGHNTALIIDFAPMPDGSLPPGQVSVGAALGTYISSCYSAPIVQTSGSNTTSLYLMPSAAVVMDRIVLREDQSFGQLVRAFNISGELANGTTFVITAQGSSIGNKFIAVFPPTQLASITLTINSVAGGRGVYIADFSAYACDSLGETITRELQAAGFPQPPYLPLALRTNEHSTSNAIEKMTASRRRRTRL